MTQGRLFDRPAQPRQAPRVMMHVFDAGPDVDADGHMVRFTCKACGHETDWIGVRNVTEGKRGLPCPKCN